MDKCYYLVFLGIDLDICLRECWIFIVILIGVLMDICVLYIVIDVYNLGYDIEIVKLVVVFIWFENY